MAAFINVPPFHTIGLPTLVPVKLTLAVLQVIAPLLAALTTGSIESLVTATVWVAVQPFPGFVTIRVYVPIAPTELFAVAGPEVH